MQFVSELGNKHIKVKTQALMILLGLQVCLKKQYISIDIQYYDFQYYLCYTLRKDADKGWSGEVFYIEV